MDRRAFLAASGGALAVPRVARAEAIDPILTYDDRLREGLADAGGGAFIEATEDRLLGEHNRFRQSQGRSPALGVLARSPALDQAARAHVADLLQRNYFAHASPEGYTSEHRVGLIARRFVGAAGENLALEDGDGARPGAGEFATLWRKSPGHRANMLRPDYTHVGFGVVAKGPRTIAAAVFGRTYAELAAPAPLRIRRGEGLRGVLAGTAPRLSGYELAPVGGGADIGPFSDEDAPRRLEPGAYAIRPHAPDPVVPYRYWVLFGPIVVAG